MYVPGVLVALSAPVADELEESSSRMFAVLGVIEVSSFLLAEALESLGAFVGVGVFSDPEPDLDEESGDGLGVGLGVGLGDTGDGVGVADSGAGVGLGVGAGVGLGVGDGVGLGVGDGVGDGVGLGPVPLPSDCIRRRFVFCDNASSGVSPSSTWSRMPVSGNPASPASTNR